MSKQQPLMSRRDWFRLRSPASPAANQPRLGAEPPAGLQSIEEPVNHGGVDLSSLPPMHEATLDAQEVAALFEDLASCATAVQLIARSAAGNAPGHSAQLDSACKRLLSGNVQKLQIRYQWQNAHWIDTLQQQTDGFRLVRIRHTR
jgi:hypothetical protein